MFSFSGRGPTEVYRWARGMWRYITKERDVCGWATISSRPQRKIAKTVDYSHFANSDYRARRGQTMKCTLHFILVHIASQKRETKNCWNWARRTISVICVIQTRQIVSKASVHYNGNWFEGIYCQYNLRAFWRPIFLLITIEKQPLNEILQRSDELVFSPPQLGSPSFCAVSARRRTPGLHLEQ